MLPKVREAINVATKDFMTKEGLTWTTIQKFPFSERYGCEFSSRTLYRIKKGYTPKIKTTLKILEFFSIPHAENYGIITLLNIQANEENNSEAVSSHE